MQTWYYNTELGGVEHVVAETELAALREIRRRLDAMNYTGKVQVWSLKRMMRGPIERVSA
ncbi:MAG: hypothetical protein IIZ83_06195 [Oscillospiraceae bacterium]|nr:hypothetical protein [Oscillospiraceae bacterium]